MGRTQIRSTELEDGGVRRNDLNITVAGQAVIRKVVQGTGVTISSTGVDSGTGDVTINIGQAVGAGNSPTFAGLNLTGIATVTHSINAGGIVIDTSGSPISSLLQFKAAGTPYSFLGIALSAGQIIDNSEVGDTVLRAVQAGDKVMISANGSSYAEVLNVGFTSAGDSTVQTRKRKFFGQVSSSGTTVTTIISFPTTTNRVYLLRVYVVGGNSGGSANGAGYILAATFKNIAGTVSQIGSTTNIATHENVAGWGAVFTISTTNILVQVNASAGETVYWKCELDIIEEYCEEIV